MGEKLGREMVAKGCIISYACCGFLYARDRDVGVGVVTSATVTDMKPCLFRFANILATLLCFHISDTFLIHRKKKTCCCVQARARDVCVSTYHTSPHNYILVEHV